MAATTIDTTNRTNYPLTEDLPASKVWTKAAWADSWTLRNDLIPLSCTFTAGDVMPTATLHYRYGKILLPGGTAFATQTRITTRGYYVLIAYATHDGNPFYWLGYAESAITSNHHPARDSLPEAGIQTVPCFGMFRALKESWITTTVHENPDTGDLTNPKRAFGGSVFNKGNRGNRSATKREFADGLSGYTFTNPDEDGEWWSSRDIIEHFFAFHLPTPTDVVESGGIPWAVSGMTSIPNWDRPVIESDGRSIGEIIAQILTPDKLLNFSVGVDSSFVDADTPPTINGLQIVPFTTIASALTLPAFGTVPANSGTIDLTCTTDPQTTVTVTEDESDVVDQIIVRGPYEIGVGTFFYADLEDDWAAGDETIYENGGSLASDWSSLNLSEKRERNDLMRALPRVAKVYRVWRVKSTWDGEVDDGAAGRTPLFVEQPGDPDPVTYVPFLGNVEFLDMLPLYSGVDYSGDATMVDESDSRVRIKPIWMIENPDSTQLEQFGLASKVVTGFRSRQANAIPITLAGSVDNEYGPRIRVDVSGGPQHAIRYGFTVNDADVPQERWGEYDYETMGVTFAIRNDRRPYFELPATADLDSDVVRRKIITIEHPSLELVNIAVGTIVEFDDAGDPVYSDGGILRDPSDLIETITTMFAEFYLNPRNRVVIETGWRLSAMQIGSILESVSIWSVDVNSPIIEISIQSPLQSTGEPTRPTMTVIAASQRFDPMALLVPINEEILESELAEQ